MDNVVTQAWREIAARPEGPLALRFYLQPAMATFLAIRDGVKDARTGEPAYLWALFTHPTQKKELLRHGWKSVGKVFILAMVLDLVYQLVVFHGVRPLQTVLVPAALALIPYVTLRGPASRVAKRFMSGGSV